MISSEPSQFYSGETAVDYEELPEDEQEMDYYEGMHLTMLSKFCLFVCSCYMFPFQFLIIAGYDVSLSPATASLSSSSSPSSAAAPATAATTDLPDVRNLLKRYSLKVFSEGRLINSVKYELNVTARFCCHRKYLEVGYSFALDVLQPIVKIACHCCNLYGLLLYFTADDWFKFSQLEPLIDKFFCTRDRVEIVGDESEGMHEAHNIEVYFTTRYSEKCISLEVRGERVFLNAIECARLFELKELIEYRLKLLSAQKFNVYYDHLLQMFTPHVSAAVADTSDLGKCKDSELLHCIKGMLRSCAIENSINYFCFLETFRFNPQKLANDVRDAIEGERQRQQRCEKDGEVGEG